MGNLEFSHAGKVEGETKKRSLVKTVIYRVLIIIADFIFFYLVTHKLFLSFWIMVISNLYTALGYYFYERLWNHIGWGRTRISEGKKKVEGK